MVHTDASIPVGSVSRVYDFYVCITSIISHHGPHRL